MEYLNDPLISDPTKPQPRLNHQHTFNYRNNAGFSSHHALIAPAVRLSADQAPEIS